MAVAGSVSAASAILSAVVFNVLTIAALVPLALRGVRSTPIGAAASSLGLAPFGRPALGLRRIFERNAVGG